MDIVQFLQTNSVALVVVFTPVILGLTEIFKQFVTNTRYAPIFSICIGVILGITFSGMSTPYGVLLGVVAGLSASGLYAGAKRVAE